MQLWYKSCLWVDSEEKGECILGSSQFSFLVANVPLNDDTTGCVCMYPSVRELSCEPEWAVSVFAQLERVEILSMHVNWEQELVLWYLFHIMQQKYFVFSSYLQVTVHCWTVRVCRLWACARCCAHFCVHASSCSHCCDHCRWAEHWRLSDQRMMDNVSQYGRSRSAEERSQGVPVSLGSCQSHHHKTINIWPHAKANAPHTCTHSERYTHHHCMCITMKSIWAWSVRTTENNIPQGQTCCLSSSPCLIDFIEEKQWFENNSVLIKLILPYHSFST